MSCCWIIILILLCRNHSFGCFGNWCSNTCQFGCRNETDSNACDCGCRSNDIASEEKDCGCVSIAPLAPVTSDYDC